MKIRWSDLVFFPLVIAIYYFSYRYPLKVNSAGTSQTYSDTPTIFKLSKYVLIFGFYFLALNLGRITYRIKISPRMRLLIFIEIISFGYIATKWLFIGAFIDGIKILQVIPLYIFLGIVGYKKNLTSKLQKILNLFFIYAVAYSIVQILLFFTTGRLPALAYAGSISVRFGGPWDDPNGFAFYLILPLLESVYILFSKKHKKYRLISIIKTIIVLFLLVLTQSITGLILGFGAFFCIMILMKKWLPLVIIIIGLFIVVIGLLQIPKVSSLVEDIREYKSASVQIHMDHSDMENFLNSPMSVLVMGFPRVYKTHENFYFDVLLYQGFLGIMLLLLNILVVTIILTKLWIKSIHTDKEKNILVALVFHLLFVIGNFNIPGWRIFPIYYIYFFTVAIVLLDSVNYTQIEKD